MAKAVVSTPAGINGLDLSPGQDVIVTPTGEEMAAAIRDLILHPEKRKSFEKQARTKVEAHYSWDKMGEAQRELYRRLTK